MDFFIDYKRVMEVIMNSFLIFFIINYLVVGKVDIVKVCLYMVSSMVNIMIVKVFYVCICKNMIIIQGEYREGKFYRVGEVSSIDMEEGIRCDIICNYMLSI